MSLGKIICVSITTWMFAIAISTRTKRDTQARHFRNYDEHCIMGVTWVENWVDKLIILNYYAYAYFTALMLVFI